jgi:hypothetical protein
LFQAAANGSGGIKSITTAGDPLFKMRAVVEFKGEQGIGVLWHGECDA